MTTADSWLQVIPLGLALVATVLGLRQAFRRTKELESEYAVGIEEIALRASRGLVPSDPEAIALTREALAEAGRGDGLTQQELLALLTKLETLHRWQLHSRGDTNKGVAEQLHSRGDTNKGVAEPVESEGDRTFSLSIAYHSQGLAHAQVSFYTALVLISAGFAVLVYGIWKAFNAPAGDQAQLAATVTIASGAIVEVAAAVLLVIANQTRKLMQSFFDRLREDRAAQRDHDAALALIDQVEDSAKRDDLRFAIVTALIPDKNNREQGPATV